MAIIGTMGWSSDRDRNALVGCEEAFMMIIAIEFNEYWGDGAQKKELFVKSPIALISW